MGGDRRHDPQRNGQTHAVWQRFTFESTGVSLFNGQRNKVRYGLFYKDSRVVRRRGHVSWHRGVVVFTFNTGVSTESCCMPVYRISFVVCG